MSLLCIQGFLLSVTRMRHSQQHMTFSRTRECIFIFWAGGPMQNHHGRRVATFSSYLLALLPAASAMSLQKQRLTPDPCLGVGDIMSPVVSWLKEEGKYDLSSLLEPKISVTWKTAPNLEWLCSLQKLFEKLLKVVPACIFPSKKIRTALQKIQAEVTRIKFSRKTMTISLTEWISC